MGTPAYDFSSALVPKAQPQPAGGGYDFSSALVPNDPASTATPLTAPAPQKPGALGAAWNWANDGLLHKGFGSQAVAQKWQAETDRLNNAVNAPSTDWDRQHPILSGMKHKALLADQDVRGMMDSASSPLQLGILAATMGGSAAADAAGAGVAGAAPGLMARAASYAKPVIGLAARAANTYAAGTGAKQMWDAATDPTLSSDDRFHKALGGAAGVVGGALGLKAAPQAGFPGLYRNAMAQDMGNGLTRGEVLGAAKNMGVNLDLADATGGKLPASIKSATSLGIVSGLPFEHNAEANLAALDKWKSSTLNSLSPQELAHEDVGSTVQNALLKSHEMQKQGEQNLYDDLRKRIGNQTPDVSGFQQTAQRILDESKPYFEQMPSQRNSKLLSKIQDAAQAGSKSPMTWGQLQDARSDFFADAEDPNLIKPKEKGWLQQMVQAADASMTKGMSPESLEQFRQANDTWQHLKDTYDNGQHRISQIVKAPDPTVAANKLLTLNPEMIGQLRTELGEGSPAFKAYQRSLAGDVLNDRDPASSFKNLDWQMNKDGVMPRLEAALGPDKARELALGGKVGKLATKDVNPSGSGRVAVRTGELAALGGSVVAAAAHNPVPLAGMLAGEGAGYAGSRAMTSPGVVNALTGAPGAYAGMAAGTRRAMRYGSFAGKNLLAGTKRQVQQ